VAGHQCLRELRRENFSQQTRELDVEIWFGKYRGWEIEKIPSDYLSWLVDNIERESIRTIAREELSRRLRTESKASAQPKKLNVFDPLTRQILDAGYRALAKKFHPDAGGDVRLMQTLNAHWEKLKG
jgi:hypothetical protein